MKRFLSNSLTLFQLKKVFPKPSFPVKNILSGLTAVDETDNKFFGQSRTLSNVFHCFLIKHSLFHISILRLVSQNCNNCLL